MFPGKNGKKFGRGLYNLKGVALSVANIAKIQQMSTSSIYNRINKGYAPDAVLQRGKTPEIFRFSGHALTAKGISARFGISVATVYSRINKCRSKGIHITPSIFSMY